MSWRLANSLTTLRNQINAAYPNRSKVSDGTIGDAAHAASASDHNPNRNGVVCALDLTHDPANGFDAHALAEHLRVNRHPNLRYVISNARIAGAHTGWQWRPSSGHYQHCHISVGTHGVADGQTYDNYDSTQAWNIGKGGNNDMSTIPDQDNYFWRFGQKTMERLRGRQQTRDEFRKTLVGLTPMRALEVISDDPEADRAYGWQQLGKLADKDKWQQQIADRTKERDQARTEASKNLLERNQARDEATKYKAENVDLKAQLALQSDDTKNLNALGQALQWAIKRLGLK